MKRIRITKIKDDAFNNSHDNGINEGFTKEGYMIEKPMIGDRFNVYHNKLHWDFSSSLVTEELNENNEFKTLYSTYKIEYLDGE